VAGNWILLTIGVSYECAYALIRAYVSSPAVFILSRWCGSTVLTLQLCSLRSEPSFDTESQDEVQGRRQGDPEFIEGSPS
jgi:hypothetical protein